jgi:hypothetical protein
MATDSCRNLTPITAAENAAESEKSADIGQPNCCGEKYQAPSSPDNHISGPRTPLGMFLYYNPG